MHRKFVWLGAAIMALFANAAQADISVKTTSIAHGVHAWYAANDHVPVVDVEMSFEGAGITSDPEGKGGRAAFTAAMLTQGAGTLDAASFQRALDDDAITLEAAANDDRLVVHIHCLREKAKQAGKLLALALGQPQLNDGDAARVKTELVSQIAQLEESPDYVASRLLAQRAFAHHPYANAPYGSAASVAALDAQDARDYLKTYVTRGNLLIAAAGDVDSGLLDAMLTPVLDVLAENEAGPVPVTQVAMQGGGEVLRQTMEVPQSTVLFTAPGIARDDPRFYAAYVLNQALGGPSLISLLSDQLRQQQGLVYYIETQMDERRGTALISGALATGNANTAAAIAAVKTVLATVHDHGLSAAQCADAKNYVVGAFALQLDSSSDVAAILLLMQTQHLGEDYLDVRAERFSNVSCADINKMAAELLQPQNFLMAVVGGDNNSAADVTPAAGMRGNDTR